jgi:hypothetical protein
MTFPNGSTDMSQSPHSRQDFIKIAVARNESEAEFIQALLLAEGVPSMLRRTPGSDVPDFLAAGPRDVLVAGSQADSARDALLHTQTAPSTPPPPNRTAPALHRLLTRLLVAVAILAILAWCVTELVA